MLKLSHRQNNQVQLNRHEYLLAIRIFNGERRLRRFVYSWWYRESENSYRSIRYISERSASSKQILCKYNKRNCSQEEPSHAHYTDIRVRLNKQKGKQWGCNAMDHNSRISLYLCTIYVFHFVLHAFTQTSCFAL